MDKLFTKYPEHQNATYYHNESSRIVVVEQIVANGCQRSQTVSKSPERSRTGMNGGQGSQTVPNGPQWSPLVRSGSQRSQTFPNVP